MPEAQPLPDGRQAYRFKIRQGILFHADPCFTRSQNGSQTREVIAADFAFALARVADPALNSPAISSFAQIVGFADFGKRLAELRRTDAAFAALPAHEQYTRAGGIAGRGRAWRWSGITGADLQGSLKPAASRAACFTPRPVPY